ncbi:MAG: histidine ammonia-lyase [Anaerolineae bacterium]|nr:histidine ammonia-lyase [Anaerolineae bacterium]
MSIITLDGENLTIDDVWAVAVEGAEAVLSEKARARVQVCHDAVLRLVERGEIAYGVTTGFGAFKRKLIKPEQTAALQVNLIRSHAAGVGPLADAETVRAMLLVRANTLAKGFSGVRPLVIDTLLDLLRRGVYPVVPMQGSLGASGDLAPLAHLALVLIGEGEAFYQGERLPGGEALRRAGIAPLTLLAKEGVALINGTTLMTALGALVTRRATTLACTADVAGAMSLEALRGTPAAFDARLVGVRPHPRAVDAAEHLRALLQDSAFLRPHDPTDIQDAYSLRCMPQVHGAVRDAVAYARWVLNIELNSANDNPLVFVREDGEAEVISGGNFHGAPVAMAMDYLAMALTDLGSISERRQARLVDPTKHDGALPLFLTEYGGLENGLMIAQYTAAALVSENKVLAHPAVIDNASTSADVEDHVSMGAIATRQAAEVLHNTEAVVSIELLCAAQGIDFRRRALGAAAQMGPGTRAAYELVRSVVPFWEHDDVLAPYIAQVQGIVCSGRVMEVVRAALNWPEDAPCG